MKLIIVLLLVSLVSCTNAEVTQLPAVATHTETIPTSTIQPPTAVPSATATVESPCNPYDEDFCITEGHFILQRPIQFPANNLVDTTYLYGSTANGARDPHHGVEFVNPGGTPVYAAADGTVVYAGPDEEAIYSPWQNYYGNLVVILHPDEVFSLYAHLSRIDVESGRQVRAGDKIGEVGRTGVAIGSHLHFEVRRGNGEDYFATQNPELWFVPARDADGNLFGALQMSIVSQDRVLVTPAEFTVQYYPGHSQSPVKSYYGSTYPADMLHGEENAALGGLSPGRYRIALERNGQLYERWVEVQSGKLTQVVFVVE
jgi:murein DD-endopeptidase MepM/ murein hydrolase activator NlpD